MINSADYTRLISAWLDYIRQEELSDLKIDASDVKDFNLYSFNGSPNFHIDKDSVTIVFDDSFYRNNNFVFYPDTESPQGNLQLYLLFPFVEKKQKGSNAVYLPLFVINVDVNLSQLTSMAISPDCSSEKQNDCSIDSNAKETTDQKLLWPKVKLTLSDRTDYIVCGSVFSELLDLDIDILKEHFFTGKPFTVLLQDIIDLISNITGYKTLHSKNLLELLTELKRQLTQAIGKPWFKLHNRFDVILLHSRQDFIETRRIKKQLSILSRQDFMPQEPNSAVYEYLYGRQQFDFETYNTPSNHPWFATFHNYSLSKGQALVLQKLAEGQKLIAVQGPPGTGKTTLLMAVVAQVLTERALAIARGLTDFPSLILVTSTANKAVENAAREFETSIELKKIPIYEHGGFYLKGGSNKNIESSIAQINTFLDWLKQTTFDEKQYEETKQKLIQSYLNLQKEVTEIEIQSNRYKTVLSQLENIDNKYKGLEKKIESLESEITRMKREFLSYSVEDILLENNYDLKQKIDEYNQWIQHYKNTPFFKLGIKYTELSLFNLDLKKASIDALTELNCSLFERIINLFTGKSKKVISKFLTENERILSLLTPNWQAITQQQEFIKFLHSLIALIDVAQQLTERLPYSKFLEYPDLVNLASKYLIHKEKLENLYKVQMEKLRLLNEKKDIESSSSFKYINSPHGVFDYLRENFAKTTELFFLAAQFLSLHAIKNKNSCINVLNLFIQLYSANPRKAIEEIKKEVSDFYRVLSLVYPVHFSSLHSSPYLFDKFISDYDPQEPYQWKLSRFKPIHLLFIDEAAMALPHLAFPAIYWAEKTIAVGDPIQIPPVVTVDDHTLEIYHSTYFNTLNRSRFSPGLTTVYHRAARCETGTPHDIGQACFLDEHRRCQSPIAKLFKEIGSYKLLQVNTPPLDIESDDFRRIQEFGGKHLVFYDVHGIPGHEERTNLAEALTIKEILKKLRNIGYYIPSIHKSDRRVSNNEENGINGACDQGENNTAIEELTESSMKSEVIIITPYRKQEEFLKTQLKDLISPQYIGTIHKFQGTEAKVVIFSSVIHKDTDPTSFINSSPNILNVAVSRAKHLFIMVGNLKKIKASGGYLNTIAEFCSTHGLIIEGVEFDETPERRYKYNKKMKELKDKSAVKVINTVQDHMAVFKDMFESAQQEIIIVCPWIRKHNLDNFSFDLIKSASERNCEISIIYGYSNNDFGDPDAIKKLEQLKNVKLIKHPATTHSKLIIVDSKIAVVGSFNWLSHSYWKTNINLGLYPRQEISLLTNSSEIIEELLCELPIGGGGVNETMPNNRILQPKHDKILKPTSYQRGVVIPSHS